MSTSRALTAPVPLMPAEVVELIVTESALDYAEWKGGMQHLSTMALLSHRFRVLANRKRFKKCKIYANFYEFENDGKHIQLMAFEQIITSPLWSLAERVSQHVEQLHVEFGPWPEVEDTKIPVISVFNSVFHNPALRKCSLYVTGFEDDNYDYDFSLLPTYVPDVAMALHKVCFHPNLSLLHISNMVEIPPSLCWSPYISELILDATTFGPDIDMFKEAFPGKLDPDMDSLIPFRNLQSLTFDNGVDPIDTWFEQNPPPSLNNIKLVPFGDIPQYIYAALYHLGDFITTLTLDLFLIRTDTPVVGPDYSCLKKLVSLTIYWGTRCSLSNRDPFTMFTCLAPFLPARKLNINIRLTIWVGFERDNPHSVQQTLLESYRCIGEPEFVRYWQGITSPSSQDEETGPFLNVSFFLKPPLKYVLNEPDQDEAYFMKLFDQLRNIRGVSLSSQWIIHDDFS